MIELQNVSTGYSKNKVLLRDVSLKFFDGKIYGVLGESGIGKTTLLRTIAGLLKPISGNILIDGNDNKKSFRSVYMMHQNYTSFDWLSCLDNILIAKKVKLKPFHRLSDKDVELGREMLSLVGLGDYENHYPTQLSGGMRQRLALARTLYAEPKYILMDEPLSALDEDTREKMQNVVMNYNKRLKATIILVTHSKEEAELMCNCIIDIKQGKEEVSYGITEKFQDLRGSV